MSTRRVAALQLSMTDDRAANLDAAGDLIRGAAAQGAELILLPEIFAAPFVGPEPDLGYFEWAEPIDGPSNRMVRAISEQLGITVISSIFEAAVPAGVYHNTTCTYSTGELVHVYRKSHLPFSNGFPEKFYFRPGDDPPTTFTSDDITIGTIICYERHFPELGRLVALQGAHVMCVPVACASAPTRGVFQLELRAHAAFNSMYVVCANRVGTEGAKQYYGLSAIYGPDGEPLDVADDEPGFAIADIDSATVVQRRRQLPFFRDRRRDLYVGLSDG